MTTLVVGEALGRNAPKGTIPLGSGRPLARLSALAGLSEQEWLACFATTNLLPAYPGEKWPTIEARVRALLLDTDPYDLVILLGRKVGEAFGFKRAVYFSRRGKLVLAPHPSGRSRWWNDPENVREAERFWRSVVGFTIPA